MVHIHLEEGAFPLPWALFWWGCTLLVLGIVLFLLRRKQYRTEQLTVTAFLAAVSFAAFQVEIPILGGIHLNLTPLAGILVGPMNGALVAFVVNVLCAGVGHGGWGLVGANCLVNFAEVGIASLAWSGTRVVIRSRGWRGGLAAFTALLAGNIAMIGIIITSGIQGSGLGAGETLAGLSLLGIANLLAALVEAAVTGVLVSQLGEARPELL